MATSGAGNRLAVGTDSSRGPRPGGRWARAAPGRLPGVPAAPWGGAETLPAWNGRLPCLPRHRLPRARPSLPARPRGSAPSPDC